MTVVMMGEISLDNSVEKSEKKNDQDSRLTPDGMRQERSLFQRQGDA